MRKPIAWMIFDRETPKEILVEQYLDGAKKAGVDLEIRSQHDFPLASPETIPDELPNFIIAYTKNVPLLRLFENKGILVLNTPDGIELCDSKIRTTSELWRFNHPQPKTFIAPPPQDVVVDEDPRGHLAAFAKELGFPFVVKSEFGSFGDGVWLVHDMAELESIPPVADTAGRWLAQEFIAESNATDTRVVVVGDEVVYTKKRVGGKDDFRSNIAAGGHCDFYEATDEEKEIAVAVTHDLGLAWAGIDLLDSANGPVICEVNSNPHFTEWERDILKITPCADQFAFARDLWRNERMLI